MRYLSFIFILAFCCNGKYIPEDGIYSVAENMAEYEGGMKGFNQHLDSFCASRLDQIDAGSVFVSFIVTKEGQLDKVKGVRSLNEQQDLVAIEAIKSAPLSWRPGIDEGKAVNVQMVYPVNF